MAVCERSRTAGSDPGPRLPALSPGEPAAPAAGRIGCTRTRDLGSLPSPAPLRASPPRVHPRCENGAGCWEAPPQPLRAGHLRARNRADEPTASHHGHIVDSPRKAGQVVVSATDLDHPAGQGPSSMSSWTRSTASIEIVPSTRPASTTGKDPPRHAHTRARPRAFAVPVVTVRGSSGLPALPVYSGGLGLAQDELLAEAGGVGRGRVRMTRLEPALGLRSTPHLLHHRLHHLVDRGVRERRAVRSGETVRRTTPGTVRVLPEGGAELAPAPPGKRNPRARWRGGRRRDDSPRRLGSCLLDQW